MNAKAMGFFQKISAGLLLFGQASDAMANDGKIDKSEGMALIQTGLATMGYKVDFHGVVISKVTGGYSLFVPDDVADVFK